MRKLTEEETLGYNREIVSFYTDREEIKSSQGGQECHRENHVFRANDGRYILECIEDNTAIITSRIAYEIDFDEFVAFFNRAIAQGEVKPECRKYLLKKAKAPVPKEETPPEDYVVFRNDRYLLGVEKNQPVIYIDGRRYEISGHYYEPVTWFTDGEGHGARIHDFEPSCVAELRTNVTVSDIPTREYDSLDLCEMFEYALEAALTVKWFDPSYAEKFFEGRPKEKASVILKDPAYAVAAQCDRGVFDCRILKEYYPYAGAESHRTALEKAVRDVLRPCRGISKLSFNLKGIEPVLADAADIFAADIPDGQMNFRNAFLGMPEGNGLTKEDFYRLCVAFFPAGTKDLEVYAWPTDWLEYFYDADEPWKACCYTILDRSLDRYVVIMASTPV